MRGGKVEDKVMGPLFPRLHVNDTEKGGPRAPPRNKMALYEQLSIPSQRFNSPTPSAFPRRPYNTNTLVASASSTQGCGHERSVFSPLDIHPPTTFHSTEKIHSQSSDGMNLNSSTVEFERKSMRKSSLKIPKVTGQFSSTAESNLFCPHNFSNSNNCCGNKIRDGDAFVVPTYVHSGIAQGSIKDQHGGDRKRPTPSTISPGRSTKIVGNSPQKSVAVTSNSSIQLQNTHDKPLQQTKTTDLKLRKHERNPSEEKPKEAIRGRSESPESRQSTGENIAESSKYVSAPVNQEHHSGSLNQLGSLQNRNPRLYQETSAGLLPENNCSDGNVVSKMESVSRARSEWCSRETVEKCPNEVENCSDEDKEEAHESMQVGDLYGNDDNSETSMVDSITRFEISPDDVVGVIGQKHFWKARRAIANQQRVFAVQVFELHRLIKVQKLIAALPDLLLESNPYLGRPSPMIPSKKLPSEFLLESQPQVVKQKDVSHKPRKNVDHVTENAVRKSPPALSISESANQGHVNQHSSCGPYSGNPLAPMATDNKSGAWCFHPPPVNQWLIPILSPSEGLVYKPYTGSCPPTAGFMAPVYGGCGPLSLPPAPAYGVPASHHQPVAQSHFPPYGRPVVNSITSIVEQLNTSGGDRTPHGQAEQISMGELNFNVQSGSSCNVSNQKSEAFSGCVKKFQTSKASDLQGSSVSSPCVRIHGASHVEEGCDMLPLFPMAPVAQSSDRSSKAPSNDSQSRVIKVVPHNPRTATESAAWIFRSIQEERQQYDSL